jgi:DNA-binding IscR family transcriptional regulator
MPLDRINCYYHNNNMATNNQFSIAVHVMTVLGVHKNDMVCSSSLATSVNANASFVHTTAGKGGHCSLAKSSKDISLLDIYKAVEAPKAFSIHNYATQKGCDVSCAIKPFMEKVLNKTQRSLEQSLKGVSLAEAVSKTKSW